MKKIKIAVFLILFFIIIYHYNFSEIHTTTIDGEACGYNIGERKEKIYNDIKREYKKGKIFWLVPKIIPQDSIAVYGIDVYMSNEVEKTKDSFSEWMQWEIHGITETGNDYIICQFAIDKLEIETINNIICP